MLTILPACLKIQLFPGYQKKPIYIYMGCNYFITDKKETPEIFIPKNICMDLVNPGLTTHTKFTGYHTPLVYGNIFLVVKLDQVTY